MPKFKLAWTELYSFEKIVIADSLEEAIDLFKSGEMELPEIFDGQYIDGTAELNKNFINEINDPITGIKEEYK
jgi:hypothetical protein